MSFNRFFQSLQRNTSGKRYLPFVDGIRFLAIMPVVILHANERLLRYVVEEIALSHWEAELSFLISRGAVGVMIFFALSGFILSLPFAKDNYPFKYKTYLNKRLTRLEPPYIFWMSFFALIYLFQSGIGIDELAGHYLASIFYVHNQAFGEFSIINPVAWSLEVEIQFYLLAPFLAKFYFQQPDKGARRSLLLVSTVLFIVYQHVFGWQYLPTKASILGHLQHFLVGLLMADIYVNESDWHSRKNYAFDLIGLISIPVLMFTWTEEMGKSIIFTAALIALFTGFLKGKVFNQFLTKPWIAIIGGMCYTIYLTHLPLLELTYSLIGKIGYSSSYWLQLTISLSIAIPLVLLSSMIFYKCIEQPFMSQDKLKSLMNTWREKIHRTKGLHA